MNNCKQIMAFLFCIITLSSFAREGNGQARGRILQVQNQLRQIIVKGKAEKGTLWLGCTFFPGTERETHLEAVNRGKKHLLASGDFTEYFNVPANFVQLITGNVSEAEYVVALWRWRVERSECHNGANGEPCKDCLKMQYHLEDKVDAFCGVWSREGGVTTREQSDEIIRKQAEAEETARINAQRNAEAEEAARKARIEEQRRIEQEEEVRLAKLAEQRKLEKEKTAQQEQIEAKKLKEAEEAARKARIEEQRRLEQEEVARQAKLAEQQKIEREKAAQQAQIEKEAKEKAERKERTDELLAKRTAEEERIRQKNEARKNEQASLGIEFRTITPQEMRKKGIVETVNRVEVVRVDAGGPAGRSRLKPGMVVIAVNKDMVEKASDCPTSGKRGDYFIFHVVGQPSTSIQLVEEDFQAGRRQSDDRKEDSSAFQSVVAVDLGGGVMLDLVLIRPGKFLMGSENGDSDEKPVHEVTISRSFYLGKYEVTQAQWEAVMGSNPSCFKGATLPVEQVSWEDCQKFIEKINSKGVGTFRLPTEAEWEYACRAGTTGGYAGNLDEMAWYDKNSGDMTHPVGTKKANPWGLYDMHGNVWEWCQDWYGPYPGSAVQDPKGAAGGSYRVARGGCWYHDARICRSAARAGGSPSSRHYNLGFRLVRAVP